MLFTLQRYEFFSKSQRRLVMYIHVFRCCLPYKGTNFSANHNHHSQNWGSTWDVVYPTKVRIFQQITTYVLFAKSIDWCCLPYKGTNFSANHNNMKVDERIKLDVVYPTKVRIFQQITTFIFPFLKKIEMLFTLQRYEFFSKSQRNGTC